MISTSLVLTHGTSVYQPFEAELTLRSGVGLTLPYTCGTENTENKKTTRDVREIEDQTPYFNSNVDTADKCAAAQPDGDLIGTAYVARDVKAISESLGEDGLIRYVGER